MNDNERKIHCIHESSHCAIAFALGMKVDYVLADFNKKFVAKVNSRSDEEYSPFHCKLDASEKIEFIPDRKLVQANENDPAAGKYLEPHFNHLVQISAGYLAEDVYLNNRVDWRKDENSDYEQAILMAGRCAISNTECLDSFFKQKLFSLSDYREGYVNTIFNLARKKCLKLLNDENIRDAIYKIASKLDEVEFLEGSDAQIVYDKVMCRK